MTRTPTSSFCLDTKRDSPQRTCESALVARAVVRRMTTGGSPITFRFSRQILNSSWRRGSPAGTRLAISACRRGLDDDRFAGIEHGGGAAFECLDTAVLASHGILADVAVLTAGKPKGRHAPVARQNGAFHPF